MRTYKEPDRKAPRVRVEKFFPFRDSPFRNKQKTGKNTKFMARLKVLHPHLKIYTEKEIKHAIININKRITDEILNSRYGVELPANLGVIFMGGACWTSEKTLKNVNAPLSAEHGKVIPLTNAHSDGWIADIYYTNHTQKIKIDNAKYWGFEALESTYRRIKYVYPGNQHKYLKVRKLKYISALIRKTKKKLLGNLINNINKEDYNEFDF